QKYSLCALFIRTCSTQSHQQGQFQYKKTQTILIFVNYGEMLCSHLFKAQTCLKCGAGWEEHGGKCYYFNTNRTSWSDSRASCRDLGGDLVKIDSREEQDFLVKRVRGMMRNEVDFFWIGLTDSETEGRWLWVDGSPLNESLTFWMKFEPDDWKNHENCVTVRKIEGHEYLKCWNDQYCSFFYKSICEKPAGTGSCVSV
uniref:C-type lectin domain-containing protein n=1 Tax=Kryptolebias marmoratus TaxID=37003 RepID=A0A3Q3BJA4_KRYMA